MKFQSGEEQGTAHAVITSKFSHTIAFNKQYCDSTKYSPLSDSSLWCILHRKNPSRLMTGFETLKNVSDIFKRTDLKDVLKKSKQYLKTLLLAHTI